jgi:hypothetical protein
MVRDVNHISGNRSVYENSTALTLQGFRCYNSAILTQFGPFRSPNVNNLPSVCASSQRFIPLDNSRGKDSSKEKIQNEKETIALSGSVIDDVSDDGGAGRQDAAA